MRQYQMARTVFEKSFSPESHEARRNLQNIAELAVKQGDEAAARKTLGILIPIEEKLAGQDSTGLNDALDILAELERKVGNVKEAERAEERIRLLDSRKP